MHKEIRIINASLSDQGRREPGSYAAFALGPSLSASTAGTLRIIPGISGASPLLVQRGRLGTGRCSGHAGRWYMGSVGPGQEKNTLRLV